MVAAWAIALYLLTNTIDRRLDATLENATSILAEGTFPFSPDLIGRLDRLIEARIMLAGDTGTIGLSTGDDLLNAAVEAEAGEFSNLAGDATIFVTVLADRVPWRAAVRGLQTARDDRYRYVVAAASLSDTRKVARDSALFLGAAMLLAAAVLAWVGSLLTRSITRPIAELADVAEGIGEGERTVPTVVDEDNEIGVLSKTLADMTGRLKDYEAEIAEQSRLSGLGDLAARMAHEVRNPLTAIKMQLQLLEERIDDTDAAKIRNVLDEIRRLELIVESTLVLGAPLDLKLVEIDPAGVIREVAELLQPTLAHRSIELTTQLKTLPPMLLDADRMKQVLLNLVNNAADELADGGEIRVSAVVSEDATTLVLSVEDSGPGIGDLAEAEQSTKPFSLGLGLTICREIVDGHGGQLNIDLSPELGGARFTIRLPVSIIAEAPG